jgi:Uma2 family endonuclease
MAIEHATIEHEALEPRPYRFTIDQYHQMGEAGIFMPGDRVELIDGEIIAMNPIGDPHAGGVNRLNETFVIRLIGKAVIAPQNPVRLAQHDEPQPDLAILRFRNDFYATRGPRPEDVLLIIEVSDSSVSYDRRVKAPLYARNGIPEYWLVDLAHGQVTVFRDPSPDGYRSEQTHRRGDTLSLVALPDVSITVADILGGPAESA